MKAKTYKEIYENKSPWILFNKFIQSAASYHALCV